MFPSHGGEDNKIQWSLYFKERLWENGGFLQTWFTTYCVPLGDGSTSLSFCFFICSESPATALWDWV